MNIKKFFENKNLLDEEINFFVERNHIKKINIDKNLVFAHISKAKHNISFFELNKNNTQYSDWLVVILYYSLYHSFLALIKNKGFSSKNHYATVLLALKYYNLDFNDVEFFEKIFLDEDDFELFFSLKDKRHKANYSTTLFFDIKEILEYKKRIVNFINKVEYLVEY